MARRIETMGQTNLAEMGRIYCYFTGSNKGAGTWLNMMKKLFPEARKGEGKNARWDFDADKVWDIIKQNSAWNRIVEKQRLTSYWELSERVIQVCCSLDEYPFISCSDDEAE